jgi:hypothetical protein
MPVTYARPPGCWGMCVVIRTGSETLITFHLGMSGDRHDFGLRRSSFAATPNLSRRIRQKMRLFTFLLLLIVPYGAFAQGACPAGSSYLNSSGNTNNNLSSLGVKSCFYVSAAGSDSNSGTSESSAWQHAPGMPGCKGVCASTTPAPAEGFIFRGGDTWHFGNSGAAPYTGGTWTWQWSGSKGSPIYIGVDAGWYSGSSWSRPILTGDNPLTPNPGTRGDSVSNCSYQSGRLNDLWLAQALQYYILDNFELVGECNNDNNQPNGQDDYVDDNGSSNATYENLYIHGWTHTSSAVINVKAIEGGSAGMGQDTQSGMLWQYIVVDGSDSDPAGAFCNQFDGWYAVQYSVFRYVSQNVFTLLHVFHDNLIEYWYSTPPGSGHGNMFEAVNEWDGPMNAVYNNVFRHIYADPISQTAGNVGIWPEPSSGTTDYYFNNVMYDYYGGGNYFDVGQNGNSGNQGTLDVFNNTMASADGRAIMDCAAGGYAYPFVFANNLYIINGSSGAQYASYCKSSNQGSFVTELQVSPTSSSYNGSAQYAYSPTSNVSSGNGTNEGGSNQHFCAKLQGSSDPYIVAAGTACESDTTYACNYNSTNHAVNCPARQPNSRSFAGAWTIGAYESGSVGPAPPVGLTATVK